MQKRALGITLIAIGKLAKAVVLVIAGIWMIGGDAPHSVTHAAYLLRIDPQNRFVHGLISEVTKVDPARLRHLGVGSFVYAALFLVEAGGLWFRKLWAEWLTLGITASFIPIEVWEIIHKPGAGKVIVLVLNVVAVIYLAIRRLKHRDGKSTASPRPAQIAA